MTLVIVYGLLDDYAATARKEHLPKRFVQVGAIEVQTPVVSLLPSRVFILLIALLQRSRVCQPSLSVELTSFAGDLLAVGVKNGNGGVAKLNIGWVGDAEEKLGKPGAVFTSVEFVFRLGNPGALAVNFLRRNSTLTRDSLESELRINQRLGSARKRQCLALGNILRCLDGDGDLEVALLTHSATKVYFVRPLRELIKRQSAQGLAIDVYCRLVGKLDAVWQRYLNSEA